MKFQKNPNPFDKVQYIFYRLYHQHLLHLDEQEFVLCRLLGNELLVQLVIEFFQQLYY